MSTRSSTLPTLGNPSRSPSRRTMRPCRWLREAWTSFVRVSEKLSGSLATAILGDRAASLLYFGLLGTDAATREFFQRNTGLLRDFVASDRAAVFAGHAAGHPRGGRARDRARRAGGRAALAGSRGRIREPSRSLHPEAPRQGWRAARIVLRHRVRARQPAPGIRARLVDPKPGRPRGPLQNPLRRLRPTARGMGPGGEAVRQAPLRRRARSWP